MTTLVKARSAHEKNGFDLHAPGLLAKWPMIGILMFVLGSLAFGGLTYNLLAHGPLLAWDHAIANTLPAIALSGPPFLEGLMAAGFYIGREAVVVIDLVLLVYFLYKRYWQELAMVFIGWAGSAVFFYALTTFFARSRPDTQIWIVLNVPGFPSGHAISVVICYGLLAYLLIPKMPSVFLKVVVTVTALFIILFVGFSRVFTGGHYLTDILAGYAVGIAWCGLAFTLIELYFQKRRNQNV